MARSERYMARELRQNRQHAGDTLPNTRNLLYGRNIKLFRDFCDRSALNEQTAGRLDRAEQRICGSILKLATIVMTATIPHVPKTR